MKKKNSGTYLLVDGTFADSRDKGTNKNKSKTKEQFHVASKKKNNPASIMKY